MKQIWRQVQFQTIHSPSHHFAKCSCGDPVDEKEKKTLTLTRGDLFEKTIIQATGFNKDLNGLVFSQQSV